MSNSSPDNPVDDDDWADYMDWGNDEDWEDENSEAAPGYSEDNVDSGAAECGNSDIIGSGYTWLCTLCGARDEFERCPCNGAAV